MSNIYNEIKDERLYQETKWGTSFDDRNTPYNWSSYIGAYSNRNLLGDPTKVDVSKFRSDMVKVAALAVAAVESLDRKVTTG